jgi:hypothetical protein
MPPHIINPQLHRKTTLSACRTSVEGKRYLDAQTFWCLNSRHRIEAYLWVVWPQARKWKTIVNVCKLSHTGSFFHALAFHKHIAKSPYGWRFKPWS